MLRMNYFFLGLVILATVASCSKNPVDDGNGVDPGIPEPKIDSFPSWSPDGHTIAFQHDGIVAYDPETKRATIDPDSIGLWFISPDGSQRRMVLPGFDIVADWSPDGKWLAFAVGAQIYKAQIVGGELDKSSIVQLTFEGRNFFPSWSSDGEWIAFDSNLDSPSGMNFIWKMRPDGYQKVRIAYEPEIGEIRQPNWSSNGKSIVHIRFLVGVSSSEVFMMDSHGQNPLRLTINSLSDQYPKYSPDGTKIAFQSDSQVWVMDSTGGNLQQLTFDEMGKMPSWSPDGKQIVYVGPQHTLWLMDADGSHQRQLTFRPE